MAGDLRDLKAKLLEAQKAEKKPQAVSQKQEPPRTKLTMKKQTPAASSGASATPKTEDVKPQLQKLPPDTRAGAINQLTNTLTEIQTEAMKCL